MPTIKPFNAGIIRRIGEEDVKTAETNDPPVIGKNLAKARERHLIRKAKTEMGEENFTKQLLENMGAV